MAQKHPTAKKYPHGWAGRSVSVHRLAALAFVVAVAAGIWMVVAEGESMMRRDMQVSWTESVHDGQLTSVDHDIFFGRGQPTVKVEVAGREYELERFDPSEPGEVGQRVGVVFDPDDSGRVMPAHLESEEEASVWSAIVGMLSVVGVMLYLLAKIMPTDFNRLASWLDGFGRLPKYDHQLKD